MHSKSSTGKYFHDVKSEFVANCSREMRKWARAVLVP